MILTPAVRRLNDAISRNNLDKVDRASNGMHDEDLIEGVSTALRKGKGEAALILAKKVNKPTHEMRSNCYYAFIDACENMPWEHTSQWMDFVVREHFELPGLCNAIGAGHVENASHLFVIHPIDDDNDGRILTSLAHCQSPEMIRLAMEHMPNQQFKIKLLVRISLNSEELGLTTPDMIDFILVHLSDEEIDLADKSAQDQFGGFTNPAEVQPSKNLFAALAAAIQNKTISQNVMKQDAALGRKSKM